MAKFQMGELLTERADVTTRYGAGTGAGNNWNDNENGKCVKFVGDSRYDLTAAGDQIEGFVVSVESATQDGYTIGTLRNAVGTRKQVLADGLQATPGTGAIAAGDRVVAGTMVAKGTVLPSYQKVCKATTQTGMDYVWRVVAIVTGTGAVGDQLIIERMS